MSDRFLVVVYTCRRCEASWCGPVNGPFDNEVHTTQHAIDVRARLQSMNLGIGLLYRLHSGIDRPVPSDRWLSP